MNTFEKGLCNYLGEENLKKIQKLKVGIAGAGGLGSNCAFNLVRSGFKKLKIVDFDVVEPSNLNRQFYFLDQLNTSKVNALRSNLLRINPDLEIEALNIKLEKENIEQVFEECDIVVEAFDKAAYKALIAESFFSSGKLVVCASGLAGWGKSDDIVVKKIHEKFYMVGDFVSEVNEDLPPISPRVNIAAAKQANIVLSYALGMGCS
ncbi:sulfur carrier protein ThiS adenylyltransferase ThiF [Acetivibrio clariflavus]|uniref:Thiamine biosynthesis protein ThiF, family 2 n=1 Tax=Acetivibrio clariflavus (strain DSM 19732 / NBRC 101661 / EBR45) TaxID=720554 RepID=G8M0N3_ACECE|nr:sulfur carrier protein ThiS adenylyltransferase ThiF [Acetivibrio clariflavus]AEV69114.1 thiamine biosynthesis protein ThiF, family 2 [Acetivibrio clariflavus DSM 19732]HPU41877.1 sulfur carrier protein ThiS adenylyltransferase ThiF [Acetivibrio clariflavus]